MEILLTMGQRLQDNRSTTIQQSIYNKRPTSMTENVLSLRKLRAELFGVADEPGFSATSATIECRKVL